MQHRHGGVHTTLFAAGHMPNRPLQQGRELKRFGNVINGTSQDWPPQPRKFAKQVKVLASREHQVNADVLGSESKEELRRSRLRPYGFAVDLDRSSIGRPETSNGAN
jgi:hypothetical protein